MASVWVVLEYPRDTDESFIRCVLGSEKAALEFKDQIEKLSNLHPILGIEEFPLLLTAPSARTRHYRSVIIFRSGRSGDSRGAGWSFSSEEIEWGPFEDHGDPSQVQVNVTPGLKDAADLRVSGLDAERVQMFFDEYTQLMLSPNFDLTQPLERFL